MKEIVKFIGEKDMAASVQDRIHMMKQQLDKYDLPIEILKQNILGYTQELIELRRSTKQPIINICGSDKSERELRVYGKNEIFFESIKGLDIILNQLIKYRKKCELIL